MELKSKLRYLFLLGFIFILIVHKMNAQVKMSARLKDDKLKVKFCNKSDEMIKVPDLSVRYGIDKVHLFDNYYTLVNDTLILTLNEELDSDLYTIKSREQNNGEKGAMLKYTDKLLQPGKTFRTKVRLKEIVDINFLIVQYEELKFECIVTQ